MTSMAAAPRTTRRFPAAIGGTGLIWNTLRQHRAMLIVLGAAFLACSGWLVVYRLGSRADFAVSDQGCRSGIAACGGFFIGLRDTGWLLVLLPWLLGIFAGAPLLTRDFETGSYRFSSVQGVSLRRQAAARLVVFGVLVAAASVLLGVLGSWATEPLRQIGLASRWQPEYFSITGLSLPAIALVDFCLGVAAGALVRRTVPAMAMTVAGALLILTPITGWGAATRNDEYGPLIRGLLTVQPAARPGTPSLSIYPGNVRVLLSPSDLPDRAGRLEVTSWFTGPNGRLSPVAAQAMLDRIPRHALYRVTELRSWMAERGIRYWIGVQPASRYWLFQAVVAAILLALAMLLACVAVWAIRPERDHLRFRGRRLAAWP